MDGTFGQVECPELHKAVNEANGYDQMRIRVHEWIGKNGLFPCRTEPTAEGIMVYYTVITAPDGASEYRRLLVSCCPELLKRFRGEYEGQSGW